MIDGQKLAAIEQAWHTSGSLFGFCEAAGIEYQPLIFESFGGIETKAEQVLKSLSRLVADNTHTPYGEVAQRLWQRISVDLQRAAHRAFARRAGGKGVCLRTGAEGLLEATEGLEWVGAGGAPVAVGPGGG